jgi:hypothetical protein
VHRRLPPVALASALALILCAACGDDGDAPAASSPSTAATAPTTTSATSTTPAEAAAREPAPGLPEAIRGYRTWNRVNAKPIPPKPSDPHLGDKQVYVNVPRRLVAGLDGPGDRLPAGTTVVKTAVRPDADFVGLVAVMRKVAGADPLHNDWEFAEYTRQSVDEPFEIIARDAVCWTCHQGAVGTDYLFSAPLAERP